MALSSHCLTNWRSAVSGGFIEDPPVLPGRVGDPSNEVLRFFETRARHHDDVVVQLLNGNSGFVLDFGQAYPASTVQDRQQIMDYFPAGFLPGLHSLARDFTVCHRWYATVPGPTWPNRFFALSGTSLGRILMPAGVIDLGAYFQQTQQTLFDRLNQAGRTVDAAGAAQRMSQLVEQVRSGVLGVPTALRTLGAAGL